MGWRTVAAVQESRGQDAGEFLGSRWQALCLGVTKGFVFCVPVPETTISLRPQVLRIRALELGTEGTVCLCSTMPEASAGRGSGRELHSGGAGIFWKHLH